jgi:hypothetical protein
LLRRLKVVFERWEESHCILIIEEKLFISPSSVCDRGNLTIDGLCRKHSGFFYIRSGIFLSYEAVVVAPWH